MAHSITLIDKGTDTFDIWVNRTNEIANVITQEVLTANTNANGAYVTGNSFLFGTFGANTVAVHTTLRGGNVQSSAALVIGSNVFVNATSVTVGNDTVNTVSNTYTFKASNGLVTSTLSYAGVTVGANVGANQTHLYVGNATINVVANSSAILVSNVTHQLTLNPGTILLGNATVNAFANSLLWSVANSTTSSNVTPDGFYSGTTVANSTVIAAGANVVANVTHVNVGNADFHSSISFSQVSVANATVSANHNVGAFVVGTQTINATGVFAGANVYANVTTIRVGNSFVNAALGNNILYIGNTTTNTTVNSTGFYVGSGSQNSTGFFIGTSVVNSTIISTGATGLIANTTAIVVGTTQVINSIAVAVGANVYANLTTIRVGNSIVNTTIGNNQIYVGNTSSNVMINSFSIYIQGQPVIDASVRDSVAWENVLIGSRGRVNFIAGNNVFLNVTDDSGGGQINVQINAVATSGAAIIGGANSYVQFNNNGNFDGEAALSWNLVTDTLTIGNTCIANVYQMAQSIVQTGSVAAFVTSSGPDEIDSFAIATYRTIEYVYSIKHDTANAYQSGKLIVLNDGTAGHLEEFGVAFSNTSAGILGSFNTDANATHILVTFTPGAALSYTCKLAKTAIPV